MKLAALVALSVGILGCAGSKLASYNPSAVATGAGGGGDYGPPAPVSHTNVASPGAGLVDDTPARPGPSPEAVERPGLGTSWGEQVHAPISFSPFERANAAPYAEVALHYNDAEGVSEHARYLGARLSPLEVFTEDNAIGIALVDETGRVLPGFSASGRTLVEGEDGARYRIVVRNGTGARFEIVASVDGLDVIDGKPADPNRRGYIVDPHDSLVIDGFRTSDAAVAAFRFGKVADSYAARSSSARNVGVVGLAIFAERGAVWSRGELGLRDTADPFPQRGYAAPPR